ncbi:hypothetical protein [Actinomadura madurae]|uniref:hypothetical protein n=1 Tax=Actinomadura madurae TaxID=1993 RepID=UPI0020D250F1|nr:hypothetical protein [Actinomadura madurae]MCP9948747.1 hypothetical protein [Actinomadura madurae]MCP9965523.1 hypothetical protein [Actinomadura madurae]MCP9978007.1 hypothetical protein [Actinomadura madurae]
MLEPSCCASFVATVPGAGGAAGAAGAADALGAVARVAATRPAAAVVTAAAPTRL